MAKACSVCNKGSIVGGGYSNRVRATKFNPTGKRRRQPNLQSTKLPDGKKIKLCASCLKRGKHLEKSII